jgi:signal transduction histidine kinase
VIRVRHLVVVWLASALVVAPRAALGGVGPRRVLILESFGRDVGPLSKTILAFRAELRARWPEPIDLFEVSLESARSNQPAEEDSLVHFLAERLSRDPVDLVVTFGSPAMGFAVRNRERLFPRSLVLMAGVDRRLIKPEFLGPATVVVGPRLDLAGRVEDILRVLPATRQIVVVCGASPLEQYWAAEYRREFARFENRVHFRWLDGQPFTAMRREVAALPANSAVLYQWLLRDAAGVSFEQDQALLGLRAVSSAPVFAYSESQLGSGIVGGRLMPDRSLGVKAAGVAVRILRGEDPARIALPPLGTLPPAFDWRELKRWGIDEARLPPGSTIMFRPPSFWGLYRWHVLGVLGIVALQSALIAGLLVQRRRSSRAEREMRQLKDQLAHSGRIATIGEMAATLAHELNQPLAAILSNAQAASRFLNSASPDMDEVRDILRDIAVDDARAGEIIRRIRSLVKKDAADLRPIPINDVVEEVVGLLHSDALIRGVDVTLELDPGLPRILADRIQLQQVLLNLLLNAFDAMSEVPPGERSVIIRSRQVDSWVNVTISDLGTGIPTGHADELFEPFRSTKPNGLGLGLSISRSIVANHGGRLWAENNRGRGATFGFTLPARAAMALVG